MSPTIVIFGATGDLTHRKLLPALYSAFRKGRLPEGTRIVGYARRDRSHDDLRAGAREAVEEFGGDSLDSDEWDRFAEQLWYVRGDLRRPDGYGALRRFLEEREDGEAGRVYYLATAPDYYAT